MQSITKTDKDKTLEAVFKPRARLLLQLGDQLIKNESIALVELVKNSYDADAKNVQVDMENIDDKSSGVITITDDGSGMDVDTLLNVWMEPGSDYKAKKIARLEASPKFHRLPLGEKGIGRFGVHKLGDVIEMTTKSAKDSEISLKIDWTNFKNNKYLDQVPINIEVLDTPKKFLGKQTGTHIRISGLRNDWTRRNVRDINRSLNALVSPFTSIDSFQVKYQLLDKPDWLDGIASWDVIRENAMYYFKVVIAGASIKEFSYEFKPWTSMTKLKGRKVGIGDKEIKSLKQLLDPKNNPFSLDGTHTGEFTFEGFVFDRDSYILQLGTIQKKALTEYLNSNSGIRIFRDNLRIYDYGEPENDWLGLDLRRVNDPPRKFSNNMIIAAISLDRSQSGGLIEKTNREGFIENESYQKFRNSILYTLGIIENLRYDDKKKVREMYGPTKKSEPLLHVVAELKSYVEKKVKDEPVKNEIVKYLLKIEVDYLKMNETLLRAAGAGLSMSVVIHEVEKIIAEILKVLKAQKASERVLSLVKHLSSLVDGYSSIIRAASSQKEDVKKIIDQSLYNTEFRLKSHAITVVADYKKNDSTAKVNVARNLMIGAMMNLIDNSIYWIERANKKNKKLFIDISNDEKGYVNIIIADNGTGFFLPTSELTEPFVSSKPGGMGLGLHIVREVMIAQGGKLTFPEWGDLNIPSEFKEGAIIALGIKI